MFLPTLLLLLLLLFVIVVVFDFFAVADSWEFLLFFDCGSGDDVDALTDLAPRDNPSSSLITTYDYENKAIIIGNKQKKKNYAKINVPTSGTIN